MTDNGQLPEAKLYASEKEVAEAWEVWAKLRVCAKCGHAFNWLQSFGSWECKQHLGPVGCKRVKDKWGITKRDYRYWECCLKPPNTARRNDSEIVWNNIRTTRPCVDKFPTERDVPGCVRCDHTEAIHILDDGVRLGFPLHSPTDAYSFAPEGGHKVNDTVTYMGKERIVAQVYFDKSVDLQDVDRGRITPVELGWAEAKYKMTIGSFCDWNTDDMSMPIKILNRRVDDRANILFDFKIMNIGMPVHQIAAMIPHMAKYGDPTSRPGWQFEKKDGKVIYPHVQNSENRLDALPHLKRA